MMELEAVKYSNSEGIATVTLNRPDRMNAMNYPLMSGLQAALDQVVEDESVRVLILTGAGRGFCAGADLTRPPGGSGSGQASSARGSDAKKTGSSRNKLPGYDPADITFENALRSLAACPVPTIARINGAAAGGGFGLSLACDISIAAQSAFFVATFGTQLGIVPDMGATWSLPLRAGRARALGIALLGERVGARQAEEWGLIWKAVPDDELDAEVGRIADILRASSPATARRTRDLIDAAIHHTLSGQVTLECEHQAVLIPRNMREGAKAFAQKRQPQFGHRRD